MLNNLKYRNLFGEKWKEQVVNVSFGQFPCESTALKGNHKWVAFPWQTNGGGVLCVVKMGHTRKVEVTCPKIVGHKGLVLDFDFCPFDEGIRGWGIENLWSMEFFVLFLYFFLIRIFQNIYFYIFTFTIFNFQLNPLDLLVTCSDDRMVRVWRIPENFDKDLTEPLQILSGHQKKVTLVSFNPVASGILATGSSDGTIRIWDITKGEQKHLIEIQEGIYPYCLEWNFDGYNFFVWYIYFLYDIFFFIWIIFLNGLFFFIWIFFFIQSFFFKMA